MNKGTAYTAQERKALHIEGLVPPAFEDLDRQCERVCAQMDAASSDLHRYTLLRNVQDRNSTLYYAVLLSDPERFLPIVYTPTVGEACIKFGHILRRSRGLYLPITAKGRIHELLDNWFEDDVRFIVVTDGSRILGLGDLGASGMGIPIGKLALYTACAGIPPQLTLPITLDVGTNNEDFLKDPLYAGIRQNRPDDDTYYDFVEEFVQSVHAKWPHCCIQFEDFNIVHAEPILEKYRDKVTCFNDDIQGTASMTVGGIHAACRAKGENIEDQRVLFLGAGSAGIGIAEQIVEAMMADGNVAREQAAANVRLMDIKGLLTTDRDDLLPFQKPFMADAAPCTDFLEQVKEFKPTAIVGVSTATGAFNEQVCKEMAKLNKRPLIMPLSNPTSRSECTAEQAYGWTDGKCLFSSGSPMPMLEVNGKMIDPAQGNNVYIFPAMGMAIFATGATHVPQEAFLVAASALADQVPQEFLDDGILYPSRGKIRQVELTIAGHVARTIADMGFNRHSCKDWDARIAELCYTPEYTKTTEPSTH